MSEEGDVDQNDPEPAMVNKYDVDLSEMEMAAEDEPEENGGAEKTGPVKMSNEGQVKRACKWKCWYYCGLHIEGQPCIPLQKCGCT